MKIVNSTCVFSPSLTDDETFEKLASLGYEGIDFDFDRCLNLENSPLRQDDFEERFRSLRALADSLGLTCHHGHSVGNFASCGEFTRRCFAASEILGIRYLVVHPINMTDDQKPLDDVEEFMIKNTAGLEALLMLAEKYNVAVLMENLPWSAAKDPRVCSEFVKRANHPLLGWCYDTGHANIVNVDHGIMAELVAPMSLHLHDNHHEVWNDEHLMPGDGDIDFAKLWDALLRAGYRGDYVLEAHHQARAAETDEQRDAILCELLRRSRIVRDSIEKSGRVTQWK